MSGSHLTNRLFALKAVPVQYLVIPKCGCTFVKNVLWRMEFGVAHTNPLRIHDDDDKFARADQLQLGRGELLSSQYAFTVIRNPVDRFLSLYFDKVVGSGHKKYVPLRKILLEHYGLNAEASVRHLTQDSPRRLDAPHSGHETR